MQMISWMKLCSLELVLLLGSGFHACWKVPCQNREKSTSFGINRHRVTRRQVKAMVLIFLCLDFVGVNAKIQAERL